MRTDLHMNRMAVAVMDYGYVPLMIKLVEGKEAYPPLHADVIAPIKGMQVIRIFYNNETAKEIMKSTPENWVSYMDESGHYHRYAPNETGISMVLCLN